MGCAQTASTSVVSPDHIPIERLYDNGGYPTIGTAPVVLITAPPIPSYVKSALKKTHSDGRGKTERLPFLNRKLPPINKSVNFDEQVLVKARTPTPSKIWYEKASSTMPMRKHRRHDDDDDDYDDEEIASISSDEEQESNEQIDAEPHIPTLGPPTLLLQRNQPNNFWYKTNTIGLMPPTNTTRENESFSPTMQQSSLNMSSYSIGERIGTPVNRIKVRRQLPDLGPPQIASSPSYQIPLQSSNIPPYQSSPVPVQPSTISPYQFPVRPPILPSYQSPIQPFSQTFHAKQTLPNTNTVLIDHRPTLHNNESLPQTPYYAFNRRPIDNIT